MKRQRLVVYLTIIILLIALLVGTLVLKQRSNNGLKPINKQNLENRAVKSSQQISLILPRMSYSRELLGRVDPFQMLPTEYGISNSASEDASELEPVYLVRGIMLGKTATALVEENGSYRRVTVGDSFAGGQIIKITENNLILNRSGVQVVIKMGE